MQEREQREVEEELRRSQERYLSFIANSSEQIWCLEFDEPISVDLPEMEQVDLIFERTYFAEANEVMAKAYGTTREELLGSRFEEVMPRDLETSVPLFLEVVRSRFQMTDFESRELAWDGTERVMLNSFVGTIEDGKLLRVWGVARDVTEQRRAENLRRDHDEEIAHASRVATMGGLTAAIAHELNQPLAAIGANAQAARRFLTNENPDLAEVEAILEDIVSDNHRAAEVIRRMRNLLKKQVSDAESLDLNELVRSVETLVRSDAILRKIEMSLELGEGLPAVRASRTEIQQVLLNLIVNGFDAMNETKSSDRRLRICTELEEAGTVKLMAIDSGHGIDDVERVFEPFHTSKDDGLGMGLAISATIIGSYGGRIWAENNEDGGARFCVSLPAGG